MLPCPRVATPVTLSSSRQFETVFSRRSSSLREAATPTMANQSPATGKRQFASMS